MFYTSSENLEEFAGRNDAVLQGIDWGLMAESLSWAFGIIYLSSFGQLNNLCKRAVRGRVSLHGKHMDPFSKRR